MCRTRQVTPPRHPPIGHHRPLPLLEHPPGPGTRFYESLGHLTHHGIDVFLFAEPPDSDNQLLQTLGGTYTRVESDSRRLMLFSRLQDAKWDDLLIDRAGGRITAHELTVNDQLGIIIIGAHLRSANNLAVAGRSEWARMLAPDIRLIEADTGHTRTVLVGDLNMNPFDPGLVETTALHAVMARSLIHPVQKLSARRKRLPFYNPMWSLLGDRHNGPNGQNSRSPGSYFYGNTDAPENHFWQMFDQVLLRPELMNALTRLEILESDGHNRLVTKSGRPHQAAVSDHLPLLFDLSLGKGNL